ncbi:MAG: HEAT repeat domain-containing protein [Pirellulales bacterium]
MARPYLGSRLLVVLLLAIAAAPRAGRADEVSLSSGGRLRGEVVSDSDPASEDVQVRTSSGIELRLPKGQVKETQPTSPGRKDYERRAARTADTVEAQLALAAWCKEQKLNREREVHLRRVLELNPDHAETRRVLGYQKVAGGWFTRNELQTKLGYVKFQGRWRTAQEVDILKRQDKDEKAEKDWVAKLTRWRNWLDGKRSDEALEGFAQISDPYAVPGLVKLIDREVNPSYRLLYLRSLSQIDSPAAVQALMRFALMDREAEVRETSLDELVRRKAPDVVSSFAKSLRSKDNVVVNRAAYALSRMGDPAAVGPLIDALITTHKFQVQQQPAGGTNASFGHSTSGGASSGGWGPSGMSMGGGPKYVNQPIRNQAALDALVALTGVNFDYDGTAWRYWYTQQRQQQEIQARRDSAPPE